MFMAVAKLSVGLCVNHREHEFADISRVASTPALEQLTRRFGSDWLASDE
jgi:hypothetical protein